MTWLRRFSYASSDTAGQLVFCFTQFYLLKFYTDVYRIPVSIAGTILLIPRFLDAIDAPVWGIVFDKTRSRWGKSRPWFLWLCVPFAVFGVLTFLTPELGNAIKSLGIPGTNWHVDYTNDAIYAAATYICCNILYTGINTPVTSILSALTPDPRERVTLTCFRMFGSKLGVLTVNLAALKMVAWLGHGDSRLGFTRTLPIFAAGTVLLYLFAFANLKEVVHEEKKSLPIRDSFRAIRGNWPWIIIFFSSFFFWIAFIARISTVPFFFQYTLGREDLIPVANSLDAISLATVFCLPFLCKWTSKRNVWILGLLGMVLGQVVLYCGLHRGSSIPWIMTGWIIGFLASGIAMAMPFSVLSDSVDYGEWKTGIRAAGFLTAIGAAFCLKAGGGLGGALPAWIMGAYGYVPDVRQTASSLKGIELGFVWLPVLSLLLSIVPVIFYKKYETLEPQIHAELERRREKTV